MTFKHSCYVKVEDREQGLKAVGFLKSIGWKLQAYHDNLDLIVCASNTGKFSCVNQKECSTWALDEDLQKNGCINCGTNLDYFFDVSAINDQNDKMQYFCSPSSKDLYLCEDELEFDAIQFRALGMHKATPSELEEYFNRKEIEG